MSDSSGCLFCTQSSMYSHPKQTSGAKMAGKCMSGRKNEDELPCWGCICWVKWMCKRCSRTHWVCLKRMNWMFLCSNVQVSFRRKNKCVFLGFMKGRLVGWTEWSIRVPIVDGHVNLQSSPHPGSTKQSHSNSLFVQSLALSSRGSCSSLPSSPRPCQNSRAH